CFYIVQYAHIFPQRILPFCIPSICSPASAISIDRKRSTGGPFHHLTAIMTRPQKIVIVGPGPVGALAALYAAQRGYAVEVYELRP
ncbi:kynurenine 3-monooxygenase, mitochondrial precursor, partial [Beauveria asiatica]